MAAPRRVRWRMLVPLGGVLALVAIACTGGHSQGTTPAVAGDRSATATPRPLIHFSEIVLIVLENQEEPDLIGNPGAPFLTQLARDHTLLNQSYAVTHPSLPNYLALISGQTFGISDDCTECFQRAPNIGDQLEAAGLSWMAYFESMPAPCTVGDQPPYVQRHNPFVYFDAVRLNDARCQAHVVPFSRWSQDLAAGTLPALSWISPNLCHDLHSCPLSEGDAWLAQIVPEILATPPFAAGGAGLLIITTDEGTTDAGCCGDAAGGHVATVLVSPLLAPGRTIALPVSHYSVLRLLEENWSLPLLGHAATAPSLRAALTP